MGVRNRRRLAIAVGAIALSVIGAAAYYGYYGSRFVRSASELDSLARVSKAEEEAFRIYRHAGVKDSTRALSELTRLLEAEEARWQGTPHAQGLAFDLALTHGRLAILSQGVGSPLGRDKYLAVAREWHSRSGHGLRGDEEMLELVAQADAAGDRGERAAQP